MLFFLQYVPLPRPKMPKTNKPNKKQPPKSTKSRKQNKTKWVLVKAKRSTLGKKVFLKTMEGEEEDSRGKNKYDEMKYAWVANNILRLKGWDDFFFSFPKASPFTLTLSNTFIQCHGSVNDWFFYASPLSEYTTSLLSVNHSHSFGFTLRVYLCV